MPCKSFKFTMKLTVQPASVEAERAKPYQPHFTPTIGGPTAQNSVPSPLSPQRKLRPPKLKYEALEISEVGGPFERKVLMHSGADPASKVRGAISVIFGSQVSARFHYCKRDEYTYQHCCEKTIYDKFALRRECYFPNCTKSWWLKLHS